MSRGISIHIGLNMIDAPSAYYGVSDPLTTCIQDSFDMKAIALSQGFEQSLLLLDDEATADAVKESIVSASEELVSGDILFLSYSGHGASIDDENSDEADSMDEAWCLYDRPFLDDELNLLWKLFDEGVRIFVVSDSCHSGTISKDIFNTTVVKSLVLSKEAQSTFRSKGFFQKLKELFSFGEERELVATVKLLAGCRDYEESLILSGARNSLLTSEILNIWSDGNFRGTTDAFFEEVRVNVKREADGVGCKQNPKLTTIGMENSDFDEQKPFVI